MRILKLASLLVCMIICDENKRVCPAETAADLYERLNKETDEDGAALRSVEYVSNKKKKT